jgi:hypothetical protein
MEALKFVEDIPLELARQAHAGTSFDPEQRAESERRGYAGALQASYDMLSQYATTNEKRALLDEEFARYRAGYAAKYRAYLAARGRCVSTMIAGGSNFPVRRQQKRSMIADKRAKEVQEFQGRALAAIKKALTPELQPIMAGASDAVERLKAEIAKLEAVQARMKEANAAIRKHAKAGVEAQVAALMGLGFSGALAVELLKPDCFGNVGFPNFEMKNNNANIRRQKARLEQIESAKALPDVAAESESGVRVEDSPADNRVRIFFPFKPESAMRSSLKANGFRWAPSLGCWQAYRNVRSLAHAGTFAKV